MGDLIYYQDGVYVLLYGNRDGIYTSKYVNGSHKYSLNDGVDENHLILCTSINQYQWSRNLLGGRVHINAYNVSSIHEKAKLTVDGISIVDIDKLGNIEEELSLSRVVSHLNAIEANGVEAFIENYKKSLEFAYSGLKELAQETESKMSLVHNEDDDGKSLLETLRQELKRLKSSLFFVFSSLFILHAYMPAGLENEKVRTACQSIIDSLI